MKQITSCVRKLKAIHEAWLEDLNSYSNDDIPDHAENARGAENVILFMLCRLAI